MPFTNILKLLNQYQTFVISTHVNPDPDALASQLAIALYLKSLKKKVYVVNEDVVPARYSFLPAAKLVKKVNPKKPFSYDAAIVVDCGDLDRIGLVKQILNPQKPIVNIDHHVTNDSFGSINFVIPDASSTAEVIYDLFEAAKHPIDKKIAALLYLGIMTDTGSFRYENTTSRTHQVVSRLLEFKLPVNEFYQRLYETVPLSDLQYFTKIVSLFESYLDGRVICLELDQETVKKFSEEFDLRDKVFRYLRTIKGAEVIVILTEQTKAKTRINFRSQGKVNVAKLAAEFSGGGHSRASGCVIAGTMAFARKQILKKLTKLVS